MAKFIGGSPQGSDQNPYANGVGGNVPAGDMPTYDDPFGSAPEAGVNGPGANPYSTSSPGVVGAADSNANYGLGANNPAQQNPGYNPMPGKYYTNPSVSSSGNPHGDGRLDDASDLTSYMDQSLNDVYGDRLANNHGVGVNPTGADMNTNDGFLKTGRRDGR